MAVEAALPSPAAEGDLYSKRKGNDEDEDEEEENYEELHYARFRLWTISTFCAIVSVGAIIDLSVPWGFTYQSIAAVFIGACTFVTSSLLMVLHFCAMNDLHIAHDFKTDIFDDNGSVFELVAVIVNVCFGFALLFLTMYTPTSVASDSYGFVRNANCFYGSWGLFICSIMLLYKFLKEYRDLDIIEMMQSKGKRYIQWMALAAASVIMTVSSVIIFKHGNCTDPDARQIPDFLSYYLVTNEPDLKVFCRRTGLAVGLGAAICFTCLMMLCELIYLDVNAGKRRNTEVKSLLESETLFACITLITLAISLGFITSTNGPASVIGNLYYSAWACFMITYSLFLSCVKELLARRDRNRGGVSPPR